MLLQPIVQREQIGGHGQKRVLLFLDTPIFLGQHHRSNNGLLVDIEASATGVNYLHLLVLLSQVSERCASLTMFLCVLIPFGDGDIHLFWTHLDQLLGRARSFKNGNDLCSPTSPILSHFHLHLCPKRHGAFGKEYTTLKRTILQSFYTR